MNKEVSFGSIISDFEKIKSKIMDYIDQIAQEFKPSDDNNDEEIKSKKS